MMMISKFEVTSSVSFSL